MFRCFLTKSDGRTDGRKKLCIETLLTHWLKMILELFGSIQKNQFPLLNRLENGLLSGFCGLLGCQALDFLAGPGF